MSRHWSTWKVGSKTVPISSLDDRHLDAALEYMRLHGAELALMPQEVRDQDPIARAEHALGGMKYDFAKKYLVLQAERKRRDEARTAERARIMSEMAANPIGGRAREDPRRVDPGRADERMEGVSVGATIEAIKRIGLRRV
jgi:hypothetical protein